MANSPGLTLCEKLHIKLDERDAELIRLRAALAQEQKLRKTYQKLALSNDVTGLPNKRFFEKQLKHDLASAKREGHPVAVLALDLDHLRDLNTKLGHEKADEALRFVGSVLCKGRRSEDMVAHIHGDEFAAILVGCTAQDALIVADEMRVKLANSPFEGLSITASIGVSGSDIAKRAGPGGLVQTSRCRRLRCQIARPQQGFTGKIAERI